MNDIIKKSQSRIKKSLDKGFAYHHLAMARSDKFLRQHDSQRIPMFVIYVDLVGSTKMSSELEPEILTNVIRVFSQEMAYAIEQYDGYVLKFVGDAVLGYFLTNNDSSKVANKIIACSKTMGKIIKNAINPLFENKNYPKLEIKITVDYGECSVVRYGSDKNLSHIDLIGLTLNLAAKMQQKTQSEQITVGKHVYEKLNSKNKRYFFKVKTNEKSWIYHEFGKQKQYSIYSNKIK